MPTAKPRVLLLLRISALLTVMGCTVLAAVAMPWIVMHHSFVHGPLGAVAGAVTVSCGFWHAESTLGHRREGLLSCSETIYAINTDDNAVYMTVAEGVEGHAEAVSVYLLGLVTACALGQLAALGAELWPWPVWRKRIRYGSHAFFVAAAAAGTVVLHDVLHVRRQALAPPDANSPTAVTTVEVGVGLVWLLAAPLVGMLAA